MITGPRSMGVVLAGVLASVCLSMASGAMAGEAGTPSTAILSGAISPGELGSTLAAPRAWNPIPAFSAREKWRSLPAPVREAYVLAGEGLLHCRWPELQATGFLEYVRTGDRSRFQTTMFSRRQQLATLVIAECVEGKGRFRDDIINGIWTICEESYWGVPAHVGMQRAGSGLPDVEEPTVDLFAAETASLLAWTSYLLHDSLDAVTPLISARIAHEVERRVNAPNLDRDDLWWMGLTPKRVNNWTPWICSNWLSAVLILEKDPGARVRAVTKIMQCLDRFLDTYEDDGGCDEGPGYWGRAGASLFDCLEMLHSATRGRIDVYSHPRIREIGKFIVRAHIAGPWFVNFADAPARLQPDAPTIFRYGRAIGDADMVGFGAHVARGQRLGEGIVPGQFGVLGRVLPALFVLQDLQKATPSDACLRDSWFPGIQVMMARSAEGTAEGFFLAAQGGHNDESHNHNDVGNFIVSLDGEPLIIDVGVETYTSKTFSAQRYSIWTMQSAYHNVPTVNGVSQKDGRRFAAREVEYTATDARASLSMDIAGAYPPESAIGSWRRMVSLDRTNAVEIHDTYALTAMKEPVRISLMTCREPDVSAAGRIQLSRSLRGGEGTAAEIRYPPDRFTARAEEISITDPQLQSSWGNRIWRIILTSTSLSLTGEHILKITPSR